MESSLARSSRSIATKHTICSNDLDPKASEPKGGATLPLTSLASRLSAGSCCEGDTLEISHLTQTLPNRQK
eukprot:1107082-Amphidinium_carterae.1